MTHNPIGASLKPEQLHADLYAAAADLATQLGVTPFPVLVSSKSPVVPGFSWNGSGNGKGDWHGKSALEFSPELLGRLWIAPEVSQAAAKYDLGVAIALPDPYGVVDIDARGVEELPRDSYDRQELIHELERVAFEDLGIPRTAPRALSGRGMHCYVKGEYLSISQFVSVKRRDLKVTLTINGQPTDFPVGVELKGWGRGYVLVPPSPHHSGTYYTWLTDKPSQNNIPLWSPEIPQLAPYSNGILPEPQPLSIPTPAPLQQVNFEDVAEVVLPYWRRGQRHMLALYLSGVCARLGYPQQKTAELIEYIAQLANDEQLDDRLRTVRSTYLKLHLGEPIISWSGIRQILQDDTDRLSAIMMPRIETAAKFGSEAYAADVLANLLRERVLYVPKRGWMFWSGVHWADDVTGVQVRRMVYEALLAHYNQLASQNTTPQEEAELQKFYHRLCSVVYLDHVVKLLAGMLKADISEFDRYRYLVTCLNCIVDLRNGKTYPHAPELRLTKLCPTNYNPKAKSELWERFLLAVFLNNRELITYMQRALGYSITGETKEQKLFIAWGTGANGKSTLFDVIRNVVGYDFVQSVPPRALLFDKFGGDAETARAALLGLRMGLLSETAEGVRLDEAQVKLLTGGDPVSARFLYQHPFTFTPTVKLWMFTNHKPHINDPSSGMWRRVVLIPFLAVFSRDPKVDPAVRQDPDPDIKDKLLEPEHREAILAWLVQGAIEWYQYGLQEPDIVQAAVKEYRQESDRFQEWFDMEIERSEHGWVPVPTLYERYKQWCENNGEIPVNVRWFGRRMAALGLKSVVQRDPNFGRPVRGYVGIRLKDQEDMQLL